MCFLDMALEILSPESFPSRIFTSPIIASTCPILLSSFVISSLDRLGGKYTKARV